MDNAKNSPESISKQENPDLYYLQQRLISDGRTLDQVNQDDVLQYMIDTGYDAMPNDFYEAKAKGEWGRKLYSLTLAAMDLLDTGTVVINQDKLEYLGNIGHMDMVGLHTTIEASDRVREEVIPAIVSEWSKTRTLKISQIMSLRKAYTTDGGLSAAAFKSGKGSRMLSSKDDYFAESETGIRNVVVWGGNFRHPNALSIRSLANRWLNRVNWFMQNLEQFSVDEINTILTRLYVSFSTLHLPLDGSGRLDGDVFDLLQQMVQRVRTDFMPMPVSTTGYRSYFLESAIGNARDKFRHAFLNYFYRKFINSVDELPDITEVVSAIRSYIKSSSGNETTYDTELIKFIESSMDRSLEPGSRYQEFQSIDYFAKQTKQHLRRNNDGSMPAYQTGEARADLTEANQLVEHMFLTAKDPDMFDFDQQIGIISGFVDRGVEQQLVGNSELSRVFIGTFIDAVLANYNQIWEMCREKKFWSQFRDMAAGVLEMMPDKVNIPIDNLMEALRNERNDLFMFTPGELNAAVRAILAFCVKSAE